MGIPFTKLNQVKGMKDDQKLHEEDIARNAPLARATLELIAAGEPSMGKPEGTARAPGMIEIAKNVMQKFLDANIIWGDQHFIFQLLKQVYEFSRSESITEDARWAEVEYLIPVAKQVFQVLVANQTDMGDITGTEPECYKKIGQEIQALFKEKNIYWSQQVVVFQMLLGVFENVQDIVSTDLKKSFVFASMKLWGKDTDEITINDVDAVLKDETKPLPEIPVKEDLAPTESPDSPPAPSDAAPSDAAHSSPVDTTVDNQPAPVDTTGEAPIGEPNTEPQPSSSEIPPTVDTSTP